MAKPKFNNEYKVPNQIANEIRGLSNKNLVDKATVEYQNWEAVKRQKKTDPDIKNAKDQIKEFVDEMKQNPDFIALEDEYKAKKEELVCEDHARLKEELKNLTEPYNEDIKSFESLFKLAMDEIDDRKSSGVWDLS